MMSDRRNGSREPSYRRPTWSGDEEPRLNEIMEDPIVHTLMDSDAVRTEEVERVVNHVRARMGAV